MKKHVHSTLLYRMNFKGWRRKNAADQLKAKKPALEAP